MLGRLEPGDIFELSFDGGETWHYASVEGYGMLGHEFTMRCVLRDEYQERYQPNPFEYTDQFDIVTTPQGNGWAEPEAYEVEPDWPAMEEGPGDTFEYDLHLIGPVVFRPTDLTEGPYDWDFWNNRPTDPVDLYERYVVDGRSTVSLADEFEVSDWTIRDWMDRAGIERRDPSEYPSEPRESREDAAEEPSDAQRVYLSSRSRKYHTSKSHASGLDPELAPEDKAVRRGYEPCMVCFSNDLELNDRIESYKEDNHD